MNTVHVVGAGIAGLACAVRLARSGVRVIVHEGAKVAGGRCRSFQDRHLGRIDNGNHLFLGANQALFGYLREIGNPNGLRATDLVFPFVDLADGGRWGLRPNWGRVPWWILRPGRRVPGSRAGDYLAAVRLGRMSAETRVAEALSSNQLYRPLWRPLCEAILNTPPERASARLLGTVLDLTLAKGGAMCRPYLCATDLADALIDPALAALSRMSAEVRFGDRLSALLMTDRVAALDFVTGRLEVGRGDQVVLAVPWWDAHRLMPGLVPELSGAAIVNAHFMYSGPPAFGHPFVGVLGGAAQWVFMREGLLSVTVSAADAMVRESSEDIAGRLWREVCAILNLPHGPIPPFRIVKERRATLAHTPAALAARPPAATSAANLFLAGDWTDTGLPCTVESAVRSGHRAAELCLAKETQSTARELATLG